MWDRTGPRIRLDLTKDSGDGGDSQGLQKVITRSESLPRDSTPWIEWALSGPLGISLPIPQHLKDMDEVAEDPAGVQATPSGAPRPQGFQRDRSRPHRD